jgi:hypothetical protein
VALVHATAHADDHQVMVYLGRRLAEAGLAGVPVSPDHVRWADGAARIATAWHRRPTAGIFRFFQAEWLPNLPGRGWQPFFHGGTPQTNPGTALLTQSKRFPLTWPGLATPLPTWRELLPETQDPRRVDWERDADWILKPALGRVGADVGIREVIGPAAWADLRAAARRRPGDWAAQRRFRAVPLTADGVAYYPGLGVFTVAVRAAGVYGRLGRKPLIDGTAQDVAVLLEGPEGGTP